MKNPSNLRTRLLARFYDVFVLTIIGFIVIYIFTGEPNLSWKNTIGWDLFYILYLIILPLIWGGYVIGKRMCNVKLKRYKDNQDVTLANTFMREVVGFQLIGVATLGISIIISLFMIGFREDKRAVHDIVGRTYVSHN